MHVVSRIPTSSTITNPVISHSLFHTMTQQTDQPVMTTDQQYDEVIISCKKIFINKAKDYGTAWRVLRTISIVDQVFIKAQRIRTVQEIGHQKVDDDIVADMKGIINYAV